MTVVNGAVVRADAIRIAINSRPEIDPGYQDIPFHHKWIQPDESKYYSLCSWVNDYEEPPRLKDSGGLTSEDPAHAWFNFATRTIGSYEVTLFVGPHKHKVDMRGIVAKPNHWQVFIVRKGKPKLVGGYLHHLSALAVVKAIVAGGRCPLALSPHMAPDGEWNSDYVVESSEVDAPIRRALS